MLRRAADASSQRKSGRGDVKENEKLIKKKKKGEIVFPNVRGGWGHAMLFFLLQ